MQNLFDDINRLIELFNQLPDSKRVNLYLNRKKNLILNQELKEQKEHIIINQKLFDQRVYDELALFDSIGVPIIGLKGVFIKDLYYNKSVNRTFNDIDLLVTSNNAQELYKGLKKLGYRIKLKTMYDNPIINMNVIPQFYMDNTQTLMMENKKKNISIDIHSNLNITNAHFIHSTTSFNTNDLFENSSTYCNYNNIKVLESHDNLCFLFRHLLKHHVFYGKTQTGLSTPLQHVMDLALIINSELFDENILLEKVIRYNVVPEAIFSLNLYNKIFISGKRIDLSSYIEKLEELNYDIKWKPLLLASLNMKIEDLMLGDFHKEFPKLQRVVEFSQAIPIDTIDWIVQSFIISFFVKRLLK